MGINKLLGKHKFTYVLEYEITKINETDTKGIYVNFSAKPNKKSMGKALKGVKLTNRYLKKMRKLGYVFENCVFEKVENDGN